MHYSTGYCCQPHVVLHIHSASVKQPKQCAYAYVHMNTRGLFSEIICIQQLAHEAHNEIDYVLYAHSQIRNLGYTDVMYNIYNTTISPKVSRVMLEVFI